jgi:hypothetical protein
MPYSAAYRRILYRMGYNNYQERLIYRHLKQEGGWDTHLIHSRDFILKALDFYRPHIVTILGTGWLLDVPLKEMAEQTEHINLVDIIHPPDVRKQVTAMKNVTLVEDDVTGGLVSEIWQKAGKRFFLNRLSSINGIEIPEYHPQFETGLIISLNILTQLDFLPVEFLKKRSKATEDDLLRFRKEIQRSHIAFLKKHKSVLITDFSEVVNESSGKTREIRSLLIDLPESKIKEEWTWNFELKREDYFNKRSVFRVLALLY